MNLKENIKTLRKIKGISQQELADKLNIDIEKMRRFEQGKQKTIDLDLIDKLIKILECDYNSLFK